MGSAFDARCNSCGRVFHVIHGGGFVSRVLHCEGCGEPRHFEHLARIPKFEEYLETYRCPCGGTFSDEGVPRCPECRSPELDPIGNHVDWD